MKLLFQIQKGIHEFKIEGMVDELDLKTLKESLFRFLDSGPLFTLLDLSGISPLPQNLEPILGEISTFAASRGCHFLIARTPQDLDSNRLRILENALEQQVCGLQAKIDLREKMRLDAEHLLLENEALKKTVEQEIKKMEMMSRDNPWIGSFARKLWSAKTR